jgi:hypothetical protein
MYIHIHIHIHIHIVIVFVWAPHFIAVTNVSHCRWANVLFTMNPPPPPHYFDIIHLCPIGVCKEASRTVLQVDNSMRSD